MIDETLNKLNEPNWWDKPLGLMLTLNWEKAAHIALIVAAIVTRFYDLGARVISHDESLHTFYSWELYRGKGFVHTPLMHGTFQFHILALVYALFGATDFTARIPAAVFGVAAVAMMWFFRKWLGKVGAILAGLFMLISPYMLYYSRYVRNESFVVVWGLIMALALFRYMEGREARWLYIMAAATALMYTTKEVSYIYVAIWLLFLGLLFLRDMFAAQWDVDWHKRVFTSLIYLAVAAGLVAGLLYVLGPRMVEQMSATATVPPADPNAPLHTAEAANQLTQGALAAVGGMLLAFVLAAGVALFGMRERLRDYASVDMMVILLTLVLPQLAAFPVKLLLKADPLDYSWQGILKTATMFVPLLLISMGIGLLWNWRKWLIAAGIFYAIFITLFTTMFTNGGGFATGMIGSLGYWLDQQDVQRGSQPWYYYIAVQTPIYEFLPAIGTLAAIAIGVKKLLAPIEGNHDAVSSTREQGFPALLFLGFWTVMNYFAYSYAGEKMPWLTVHLTLPMIMLAGWVFGRLLQAVDWHVIVRGKGWAAALLIPLVAYGLFYALYLLLFSSVRPFSGTELAQLQTAMSFLSAVVVTAAGVTGLIVLRREVPLAQMAWMGGNLLVALLVLLTARAAFYAAYINYDRQTEFINYASGAPGVRTVMDQVEEISLRTTDGYAVRVAYDDDVSWPITWYMRNYSNQVYYGNQPARENFEGTPLIIAGDNNWGRVEPLLGNRYYSYEYIRMWWPMQEYFNLNLDRLRNAANDPAYRAALFDIWFYRDYSKYGQLTGVDYSLSRWPVSDRMRLYIRKDVAAQLWSLGVGPAALEPLPEDPYANAKQLLIADKVWGVAGSAVEFNSPRAVAVGPGGDVYVADTRNHRIQQFDAEGQFIRAWGAFGSLEGNTAVPGSFNEIWGIAVDANGFVYAADTWNHRIQKFTADGQFVTMWGAFGLKDAGLNVMWGPRGITVDKSGNIYVADTGNKRVLVFDGNGNVLRSIGASGALAGELDEPTGVAVANDGRVFVADTWNQRVQVFSNDGSYLGEWGISGWHGQSLDNKPQLALDHQGSVYVSDPEGYRVLVFSEGGQFLYTFGDYGFDPSTFALPVGVAVGNDSLYVTDAGNNRIMRFRLALEGN